MFDYLYGWVQNIAFYMVMVTAVMHIIPNPEYKRYIRFFTGMVLTVMLTGPFLKLLGMGDLWQNLYAGSTYQEQVKKMERAVQSLENMDTPAYLDDIPTEGQENIPAGDSAKTTKETEESDEISVEEIRIGR